MFTLNFSAYCGMSMKIAEGDSDSVRKVAADILRHRRKDFPIYCLEKGNKWEIGEPEGCMMIPDSCGILKISEEEVEEEDFYDDSMDGDFDSSMRDAGFGTDEDYGCYGEDY
jgi:hypothetical protein